MFTSARITPGPDGGASTSSGDAAQEGPLCLHNQPTVLRVLNNGSKVYVCSRYPLHHCRTCCPADVMLLSTLDRHEQAAPAEASVATPSSPQPGAAALEPDARSSPPADAPADAADDSAAADPVADVDIDATPSSQHIGSQATAPDAPTKGTSTATSKAAPSAAVRSLIPIFSGFTAAALRANQLGGRFMMLRPQAAAVARMQVEIAEAAAASPAATPAGGAPRKRQRQPDADCLTPTASGPASVATASRGVEPRLTTWLHHPAPVATASVPGRAGAAKMPRH